MRVTSQMLAARTTANLSSSVARLLALQTQMSTARKLLRPSDDPIGVTRDLSYRTTIDNITQYQGNISAARTQLNTIEQALGTAGTILGTARELATAMADDTFDQTAREGAVAEAKSLLDQMIRLANTQIEGRYIFSGHQTRTAAILATPSGMVYQGDRGVISAQIEAASTVGINLIGSDVFLGNMQTLGLNGDLNRGVTAAVALNDLYLGNGIDQVPGIIQVTDTNLGITVAVDISAATTVGGVISAINTQLTAGGITSVTASVSPSGNGLRLEAVETGTITNVTPLSNLNRGAGMDLVPGKFRVSTDDGLTDVEIDLSTATDIGDVYTLFNLQMAAAGVTNVTMGIDPTQTRLRITDGNVPPLGLKITDPINETTAHDLGLLGYIDGLKDGQALNPKPAITIAEGGAGETSAADLGILGSFSGIFDGGDLDPMLKLSTPLSALDGGRGLTLGRIRIQQGDRIAIVDLTTATTVSEVVTRINNSGLSIQASINPSLRGIQVIPTVSDRSLMITDEDATRSAAKLGIKGSPDLLGNLMLLIDGLQRNDREAVGALIGTLEAAANKTLETRSAVGAGIRRMNSTSDRLADLELSMTRLLSEIEDADIIKVTTELATQQNIYQAALNASARVLMPSLVDFIR